MVVAFCAPLLPCIEHFGCRVRQFGIKIVLTSYAKVANKAEKHVRNH